MTVDDFRRLALSLEDTEESSHMGAPDFRVGGRIFATLAMQSKGFGNLMLTPEMQADFIADQPDLFLPVPGGWGRMGITHLRLAEAPEEVALGALRTAWRLEKQKGPARKRRTLVAAKKAAEKKAAANKTAAKNSTSHAKRT